MQDALARHDELLRHAVDAHGGAMVKTTGDGIHAAFPTANHALGAAITMQHDLGATEFGETGPLRVRMGAHTCEAELRDGDYYGSGVNRAARLMSVAHGGQIVVSAVTAGLSDDRFAMVDLGEHRLRDLSRAERVWQVDLLDSLVRRSMLVADERDGATRYRLLETIRQFGAERLEESGDAEAARATHLTWCRELMVETSDGIRGIDGQAWVVRLDRELDNWRAAIAFAIEANDLDALADLFGSITMLALYGTRAGSAFATAAVDALDAVGEPDHAADPVRHARRRAAGAARGARDVEAWADALTWVVGQIFDYLDFFRLVDRNRHVVYLMLAKAQQDHAEMHARVERARMQRPRRSPRRCAWSRRWAR